MNLLNGYPTATNEACDKTIEASFRQVRDRLRLDHHDSLIDQAASLNLRVGSYVGHGSHAIVFELPDGLVLKLELKLGLDHDRRYFDIPMIKSGVHNCVQWSVHPRAEHCHSFAVNDEFAVELFKEGWNYFDQGPRQLGIWAGRWYLLDHDAVKKFDIHHQCKLVFEFGKSSAALKGVPSSKLQSSSCFCTSGT